MSKEHNFIVSITNKTNNGVIVWKFMNEYKCYLTVKKTTGKPMEMWYNPDEKTIRIGGDYINISNLDEDQVMFPLSEAIKTQIHNRENIRFIALQKQKDMRYEKLLDTGLSW